MKTQKLIKRFEDLGLKTEMNFDEDESCFILRIFNFDDTVVEIYDSCYGTDFIFGDGISLLDGGDASEVVNILYKLVVRED